MKKTLSLLLAVAMLFSLAVGVSCADTEYTVTELTGDYDEDSAAIYDAVLGEFYETYLDAATSSDMNERYALMAIAEAKLLEAAVFLPTTCQGGAYAIRRTAPGTATGVKWGSDMDRYHNVVVTNELITAEDYNYMKSQWNELKGTGTYEQFAKDYLTGKGYTLKDSYTFAYTTDPETWDVFSAFNTTVSEPLVNTYDGLVEYDCENILQGALAESWECSDDGLTWTFNLRQGVVWVDSQGRKIADLTSDDFAAGLQHFLDAGSGAEYLAGYDGACVLNADEYTYGEVDFSEVGISTPDDYTVVYTLSQPCPFFETLLTYTTFAPLCRSYFTSLGGAFGADYDANATTFGSDADHIAYCGPYLVTNATAENTIVFSANPSYWNAENINNKSITWLYNDGTDPRKSYDDCMSGVTDATGLDTNTIVIAKEEGTFETYAITTNTDATSYCNNYNLNRAAFANYNDETKAVSAKTDEQKELTYAAMGNQHFRLALNYSVDRVSYNAQSRGEELAAKNLINSYVTGTFAALTEDVTVDINGTETTFAAGTWYGEMLQAQLTADGYPIKVWDEETASSTGFDGWFNPEAAAEEMAIAVEELAAAGYEISAENPVVLDISFNVGSTTYTNRANAIKQSMETYTNGLVQVNLVECADWSEWYYTEYYAYYGYEKNFDIGTTTGWSPDFGDPSTFLITFMPDYLGYCTAGLGIY